MVGQLSRHFRDRLRHRDTHGDEGVALLVAIAFVALATSLGLTLVAVTTYVAQDSGADRQRALAVSAAEAGIDYAYASLQGVAGTAFPCGPLTSTIRSAPDQTRFSVAITYMNDVTQLPCSPTTGLASEPTTATLVSTGTLASGSTAVQRVMSSYVRLSPNGGNAFSDAIYSGANMQFSNNGTVTGNGGPNADLYVGGQLTCTNNVSISGTVRVAGATYWQNACSADGNLISKGNIGVLSAKVGGDVTSLGTISISGYPPVTGTIKAQSTISGCSGPLASKCTANASGLPAFTSHAFPTLNPDATALAAWTAAGYKVVDDSAKSCAYTQYANYNGNTVNSVTTTSKFILDFTKTTPTPPNTVYVAPPNCPVNLSGVSGTINLPADLIIYSSGGALFSGTNVFASSVPGTIRNFEIIVPSSSTAQLNLANSLSATSDVTVFMYTPGPIQYANTNDFYGQLYSGQGVNITNNFSLHFRQAPVFGVSGVNTTPTSHKVTIVYKREGTAS